MQLWARDSPAEPATSYAVRRALAGIARGLHLDERSIQTLRLAASEAVADAVIRARGLNATISVNALTRGDELRVTIADDATPPAGERGRSPAADVLDRLAGQVGLEREHGERTKVGLSFALRPARASLS